jgi:hypothetical protein
MHDKLEQYIAENRDQFDREVPDPEVWKKVERSLRPKFAVNWRFVLWRAAGVASIVALSFLAGRYFNKQAEEGMLSGRAPDLEEEIVIPELQEAEAYYTGLVHEKMEEIRPMMLGCPSLEEDIQSEFAELDNICRELKRDLRDNIANEEVIQAIIDNYRMKIEILEMMIGELQAENDYCIPNTQEYEM